MRSEERSRRRQSRSAIFRLALTEALVALFGAGQLPILALVTDADTLALMRFSVQ